MDYFTAAEIAKHWNISSRMVAYDCQAGRINGAVKKGKVWLIPMNAEKPADQRRSKQSNQNGNNQDKNNQNKNNQNKSSLQGEPYTGSEIGINAVYHTSDVYHNLGLTRETLRYYEEIGLIKPKRSRHSQYREFDLFDMSRLMAIDFFKKRGFTPAEIRELQNAVTAEKYDEIMQKKIHLLRKTIDELTEMSVKLETARHDFIRTTDTSLEFTVKELPPYYVQDTISSVANFSEYRDKVINYLNTEREDILSNMVRVITFDENGYKTSGIYIVKPAAEMNQSRYETLLPCGRCLYTTLITDHNDTSVPEKMFSLCHAWAKQHHVSFLGVVYIFIRFVTLHEQTDQHHYEVWVPLQD